MPGGDAVGVGPHPVRHANVGRQHPRHGVTGADWAGTLWHIRTPQGTLAARTAVVAAGLWGDRVEALFTGKVPFAIRPRKGQFIVYDKPAARLLRHIVLPVPTETTKGVVLCRTVYGNLLVGPTAEEQEDRRLAVLHSAALVALRRHGESLLPALAGHEVTAAYAGLRPATECPEYRVTWKPERRYLGLGGIRSTGLSAALGLARHASELIGSTAPGWTEPATPRVPRVPNISECAPRDWQRAGHGGIICHCELVTRREIEAALDGPAGARTLGGLKRRTRVTMGRCHGFYSSEALARLTAGRLAEPMGKGND